MSSLGNIAKKLIILYNGSCLLFEANSISGNFQLLKLQKGLTVFVGNKYLFSEVQIMTMSKRMRSGALTLVM